MRFEDDKPLACEYCGRMIYAGDYALIWNNKCYCSEDCVKDAMYEDAGVSTHYIMTAGDKEVEYGDMKYDEMRGK
jgi:hypothetical protein